MCLGVYVMPLTLTQWAGLIFTVAILQWEQL